MSANAKQLFKLLDQQVKAVKAKLNEDSSDVNEIPSNFNQVGWELSIEKVEQMLATMKEAYAVKGTRLTPPAFRPLFNRAVVVTDEMEKFISAMRYENQEIDFDAENKRLTAELAELNQLLLNKNTGE